MEFNQKVTLQNLPLRKLDGVPSSIWSWALACKFQIKNASPKIQNMYITNVILIKHFLLAGLHGQPLALGLGHQLANLMRNSLTFRVGHLN